jgi:hypothetical protein
MFVFKPIGGKLKDFLRPFCISQKYTAKPPGLETAIFPLYNLPMETKKQPRGRPRKNSANAKTDTLLLRLEPREKQAFANAAKIAGAPLAVWIRERLRWAATRELEAAAKPIPFLQYDDEE